MVSARSKPNVTSPPCSRHVSSDDETCAATLRLVGAYQSLLGQKRWETWIDLWAEDGVFDFPFAPHGRQRTYRGKAESWPI